MGTTLIYNDVAFINCKTVEYRQQCVWDSSGTDVLRHETTITVQGIAHQHYPAPQYIDPQDPSAIAAGGAAVFHALREKLMCPRHKLSYYIGETTVIDVAGASGGNAAEKDVDNGPRPVALRLLGVYHNNCKVEFTITASHVSCCGNGASLPAVINNRWSMEERRDSNFVASRIAQGRLRVSSIDFNPQSFRAMVVPRLERGWKIVDMSFRTDPSGMELEWSVVHQQEHAAPPRPAVAWDCRHTVSTSLGGIAESHFHIDLLGKPGVDRRQLLAAGVSAAESRLGDITSGLTNGKGVIQSIVVSDIISEPRVSIDIHFRHAVAGGTTMTAAHLKETFGQHLAIAGYDPLSSPQTSVNPTSLAGAFFMYLQDACEGPNPINQGSSSASPGGGFSTPSGGGGDPYGGYGFTTSFTVGQLKPGTPRTSDETQESLYTYYRIETTYETKGRAVALPVAKNVDALGEAANDGADEVRVIRLGPGVTHRIVSIMAERIGQAPSLPTPRNYIGQGHVASHYLDHTWVLHAPELMPDANALAYRAEMTIIFALANTPKIGEQLPVGASPADKTTPRENEFSIKEPTKNIL